MQIVKYIDRWLDGQIDLQIDKEIGNRQIDIMDRQILDWQGDRWMDRQIDR